MADPGNQPPSKSPVISKSPSQLPTVDVSTHELCDKIKATRSAILTLIKDTAWPPESISAVQSFLQTMSSFPELPAEGVPVKDDTEKFILVLEGAHTTVKKASDKYGSKERGFRDGIKYSLSSLRPSKCTNILQTCQDDLGKALTMLRSCFDSVKTIDSAPSGSGGPTETLAGIQDQPTTAQAQIQAGLGSSRHTPSLPAKSAEQADSSEHPTGHQASVPESPSSLPKDQDIRSPIRDGVITAARMTFKTVETVSGSIPVVGDFVGVAAKVGLAFVNMIETMDKNEDVSKDLASHTSKLSTYLEYFKKKSAAENGDEVIKHINDLHKELECVQKKVSEWKSTGRLKKALMSSDYAEELKVHQDTVQNTLEQMQLLVSLKTADLVSELGNKEMRAERHRLLGCLGDGSYGARGSSIEDVICLPGTRVWILERIDTWIKDTSASTERVLWIRGMAGRGKSAIASTVAHHWSSKGSCAIFHFRRGQNALDGHFICALARQLGKCLVPEVKNTILDCVRENEDIAKERLDQQFKILFVGSLGKLHDHPHPILIIVDALDECNNATEAVRFVRLIDQHSSLLPANVKFLLTCRPEAPLLVALKPRQWHAEDLDSIPDVSDDISRFIEHACAQIKDDHSLPNDWPASTDLDAIVRMSQGVFQWARTAITYVSERSPASRLRDLLQRPSTWSGLDELYHQILSRAFNVVETDLMRRRLLSWMLGTLVVAPYPVSLEVIAFLHADHKIFQGHQDIVQYLRDDILADLNSLLHIPASKSEPVRLMHTSIRDLLIAQERCRNQVYFVDPVRDHRRLAEVTLRLMVRDLRPNICELSDAFRANSEIQSAVEEHVSKGLRYCCRSWSTHLTTGLPWSETETKIEAASEVLSQLQLVSEEKLLSWLEVMSVIGVITEAFTAAKRVHQWLVSRSGEMRNDSLDVLWHDAQRFIAAFLESISFSPLHIYASALPQCPAGTKLWANYGGQVTSRILLGKRQLDWPANIWTVTADSQVVVIAFSPDGRFLAFGLWNGTIELRDAQSGASLGDPLTSHSESITCVVFSPDSTVLASASDDKTVRLWDVQAGAPLLGNPLIGHNDSITSVIFSPDSKVLASASRDKTVRLWDAQTGAPLLGNPLTGHSDSITSMVFSQDSNVLTSVSEDKTVRFWNVKIKEPLSDSLTGHRHLINPTVFSQGTKALASVPDNSKVQLWHTSKIKSVALSPDSKVLASASWETVQLWDVQTGTALGSPLPSRTNLTKPAVFSPDSKSLACVSDDETVQLRDVRTGAPLGNPLTNHRDHIQLIVFSPDSKALATEFWNRTVQLWDAQTGTPLGNPLTGHSDSIMSVVFSPDSKVLASGSSDKTVRLCNVHTGPPLGNPLTGHNNSIASLVFAPDSKIPASGSKDNPVQLLDAQAGGPLDNLPTGHSDYITSVVFSPDGKILASRSRDKTVRLWNAETGASLGNPLTGHSNFISSVVFSPDSKILASLSEDKTVRLWDVQTGAPLGNPLIVHKRWITAVFSPDSKVLASEVGSEVQLWDVQTGAPIGNPLNGNSCSYTPIAFSPDGKVLAFGSGDDTVQLWDVQAGAPLGNPLTGHRWGINSVVFSPDSKVLASASGDKTVRLWDAQTGAPLLGNPLSGHSQLITSVVFSPDSKVLASVSPDKRVRLWDVRTGAPLGNPLAGHGNYPSKSIVFSSDSKVLASMSKDKKIWLWDAQTGASLGNLLTGHGESFTSIVFPPDSKGSTFSPWVRIQSNWVVYGSRRLFWLSDDYRNGDEFVLFPSIGRLAFASGSTLVLLDVSSLLKH